MQVPPHPHMGLQTVSWLLSGEVHHRDSLGNDQLIHPGELGLMTSGHGIAHAEQSPVPHPALLHGVQLWVALPDQTREVSPGWSHHAALPRFADAGVTTTVIMGELAGAICGCGQLPARASCCSAVSRSASRSSCGGTSSAGPATRSRLPASSG